jgi:broad specificity phosphatase PhoE
VARRLLTVLCAALAAVVVGVCSALPAWAAQTITLTWVRHAQSTANAAGIVDTTVPGPGLTALGDTQAQAVAGTLAPNGYDGIYISDMLRTQLTAAPLATAVALTPVVATGVREINAGVFEGRGGLLAGIGYALPPVAWVLGARFVPVLGGENGNGFDARVDAAVATIYAGGESNPVVFSHGATIMAWTLMTVDNPNLLLALTRPLGNTAVVVVNGNPDDGWTLQSWDGVAVDPTPGPLTRLFVAVRDAVVAPQTALYENCHRPVGPAAVSRRDVPKPTRVALAAAPRRVVGTPTDAVRQAYGVAPKPAAAGRGAQRDRTPGRDQRTGAARVPD